MTKSNALTALQEKVATVVDQLREGFQEEQETRRSEFTEALIQHSATFKEALQKTTDSADRSLEGQKSTFNAFITKAEEDRRGKETQFQKESDTFIDTLKEYKSQAEALVHVIGNTGMVGGYQRVANEERRAARFWKGIAGTSMLGLVGFAIYAFVLTLHSGFSWGLFAGRAFVAVCFGILSTYAAREAEQHSNVERQNRRMELELASINPYLAEMPKEVQQQIKQKLAERLFAQAEKDAAQGNKQSTSGTALDVVRVALENVKVALEQIKK